MGGLGERRGGREGGRQAGGDAEARKKRRDGGSNLLTREGLFSDREGGAEAL